MLKEYQIVTGVAGALVLVKMVGEGKYRNIVGSEIKLKDRM